MGEQSGPQSVKFEVPKPEMGKAVMLDVVKIGDSERRRPEEARAVGLVGATMEFLGDLGKANLAAKKELGEMASDRITKALLVGAIGGGMEMVAESAFKTALQIIKPVLPTSRAPLEAIKKVIDQQVVQEWIEDIAVWSLYKKGNAFLGGDLPKVPLSYLGMSALVDVVDNRVHKVLGPERQARSVAKIIDPVAPSEKFTMDFQDMNSSEAKGKIPIKVSKIANLSNPVTLFGAAQVVEGVSAYARAVGEIRSARKAGGAMKVDALLEEAKKAKTVGAAKRDKQERFLELYEKMGKDE
ncbi:hypothetical protein HY949_02150 [Candidatus Gottesmanbacteria bacterium]|nr:hypothetical protein [Candidatus Gottesmanbacteria bacterium]